MRKRSVILAIAAMIVAVIAGTAFAATYTADPKDYALGGDTVIYQYADKVVVRETTGWGQDALDNITVWPYSDIGGTPTINKAQFAYYNIKRFLYSGNTMYVAILGDQTNNQGGRFATVDVNDNFKIIKERRPDNKEGYAPTAEYIAAYGGSIYGLSSFCQAGGGSGVSTGYNYKPSVVYKLNSDMTVAGSVELKDTASNECLNSENAAVYNGKMYVCSAGGSQNPGSFGSIWEVDLSAMTARQIVKKFSTADFNDEDFEVVNLSKVDQILSYGIAIADNGTVMHLVSFGYGKGGAVYKTTVSKLQNGDIGDFVYESGSAMSFSIQYINGDFWLNDSGKLIIFGTDGTQKQTFTTALSPASNPGQSLYSFAPIVASGQVGAVYTTVDGTYSSGIIGRVYAQSGPGPAPTPTPTPTPDPDPSESPTPTPGPTDEPTPTPGPTDEPTPTPGPTGEPTPTPAPTESPVEPVIVPEEEKEEIRTDTGLDEAAKVESIEVGVNATISTSTTSTTVQTALGSDAAQNVSSMVLTKTDSTVSSLVFDLKLDVKSGAKTVGGTPVTPPRNVVEAARGFNFFVAFGSQKVDLFTLFRSLLQSVFKVDTVTASQLAALAAGDASVRLVPDVVLVSDKNAKIPSGCDWKSADGNYAVKLSADRTKLYLYDRTASAQITAALTAKASTPSPTGSPTGRPYRSNGGVCDTGAGLFLFGLLGAVLVSRKKK